MYNNTTVIFFTHFKVYKRFFTMLQNVNYLHVFGNFGPELSNLVQIDVFSFIQTVTNTCNHDPIGLVK